MTIIYSKNKNPVNKKGFTLLETLVAILLLSVSIAGAATIAQKSLQAAEYSRDETTAYYLAAEGIELVRNIRDANNLAATDGTKWLTKLSNPGDSDKCDETLSNVCDIDPLNENIITPCTTSVQGVAQKVCQLYESNYQYSDDSGGTPTNFYRGITVQPVTIPINSKIDEADVTVTVAWSTGSFTTRSISLEETIYNWYGAGN